MKYSLQRPFHLSHGISKPVGTLVVIFVVVIPHFLASDIDQEGQTGICSAELAEFFSIFLYQMRSRCQLDSVEGPNQFLQ